MRQGILAILVCLHTTAVATADEVWLLGAEGGSNYTYAYLGYMAPLQIEANGQYYQRYWLDWVDYSYTTEDTEVKAEAPGAEVAFGKQIYHQGSSNAAVFVGLSYRDTDVDPDNIKVDVKGQQLGAKLQVEAEKYGQVYHLSGIASYITGLDSYWLRGRITTASASGTKVSYGSELVLQGDQDYFAAQFGILLGNIKFGNSDQWLVKTGVRHVKDQGEYGYVGFEALLQR